MNLTQRKSSKGNERTLRKQRLAKSKERTTEWPPPAHPAVRSWDLAEGTANKTGQGIAREKRKIQLLCALVQVCTF